MKNTRTKQTPIQRAMKIVTSITLLAMLFVLVLAGTLSGAFGVEENLVQNGKIEGNVASAAGVRTFQTIDLSGTFKNTTDTLILMLASALNLLCLSHARASVLDLRKSLPSMEVPEFTLLSGAV